MERHTGKGRKALMLVLFMVLFVTSGCGWIQSEEKGTVWTEGAMLRVGETQVDIREGMVYLDAVQKDYEQYYGSDIWKYAIDGRGNTLGTLVKEQTLEQIVYVKIICKEANSRGIVLSEEELQMVDEQTREYMEKLSGSRIQALGVNEDIVRRIYADNLLARKTFEYVTLNIDTDISNEEAGQHRFYSIAIRNYKIGADGVRVSYSETEEEELRQRMQEFLKQAKKTDDFYKYANSITEDSSMLEFTAGKGNLPGEYEDTILALKDGELSEVIETKDYFYIFYCVTEFDLDATHERKEQMIVERQEAEFKRLYEEWKKGIEIELNEEVWGKLDFAS